MKHILSSKVVSLSEKQRMLIARCSDQGLSLLDLNGIEALIADLELALLDAGGENAGAGETPGDVIASALQHAKRTWQQTHQERKAAATGNGKDNTDNAAAKSKPAATNKAPAKVSDAPQVQRRVVGAGRNFAVTDTLPLVGQRRKEGPAAKTPSERKPESTRIRQDESAAMPFDSKEPTAKDIDQKTSARAAERAALKAAKKATREAERATRKAARIAERETAKAARKAERKALKMQNLNDDAGANKQKKNTKKDKRGSPLC